MMEGEGMKGHRLWFHGESSIRQEMFGGDWSSGSWEQNISFKMLMGGEGVVGVTFLSGGGILFILGQIYGQEMFRRIWANCKHKGLARTCLALTRWADRRVSMLYNSMPVWLYSGNYDGDLIHCLFKVSYIDILYASFTALPYHWALGCNNLLLMWFTWLGALYFNLVLCYLFIFCWLFCIIYNFPV